MREVLRGFPQSVVGGQVVPNSAGIKTEQFVFVKGMLGQDPVTGELASDEVRGQTRKAIENAEMVLKEGGSSLEKVVSVMVLLVRREDFTAFNEVYAEYFSVDPPTRTAIIAGIAKDGALVEITVTAVV